MDVRRSGRWTSRAGRLAGRVAPFSLHNWVCVVYNYNSRSECFDHYKYEKNQHRWPTFHLYRFLSTKVWHLTVLSRFHDKMKMMKPQYFFIYMHIRWFLKFLWCFVCACTALQIMPPCQNCPTGQQRKLPNFNKTVACNHHCPLWHEYRHWVIGIPGYNLRIYAVKGLHFMNIKWKLWYHNIFFILMHTWWFLKLLVVFVCGKLTKPCRYATNRTNGKPIKPGNNYQQKSQNFNKTATHSHHCLLWHE